MLKFCKLWLASLLLTTLILSSCTYMEPYLLDFYEWFGLKPDNVIEDSLENVTEYAIESYTGLDVEIEFTPSSPEKE